VGNGIGRKMKRIKKTKDATLDYNEWVDIIHKTISDNKLPTTSSFNKISEISAKDRILIISHIITPTKFIKSMVQKDGTILAYVEVNYIRQLLNLFFPGNWSFEILSRNQDGNQLTAQGKLTIWFDNEPRVMSVSGGVELDYTSATNSGMKATVIDKKITEADTFKKCASFFGFANDVYSGEYSETKKENKQNNSKKPVEQIVQESNKEEKQTGLGFTLSKPS
jgi:hypothetical protein